MMKNIFSGNPSNIFMPTAFFLNGNKACSKSSSAAIKIHQLQGKIDYCESRINEIAYQLYGAWFPADNRVVFNIKGNHYRLVVKINYDYQIMWIRFIGTHAEYDKINAKTI